MKKIKKLVGWMVMAAMILGLTGCGSSNETIAATTAATTAAATEATTAETTEAAKEGTSGSLFDAADAPTFNIILAHGSAEQQLGGLNCTTFKEEVEERSNGKITVEVYPNCQLGTDAESFTSTQMGTIQMTWMATGSYSSYIQEVGILSQPMLFTDINECYKLLEVGTEFRTAINDIFDKNDLVCVSISPTAFRTMSSNIKVESMDDFKGINIRTMDDKFQIQFWNALGCNATPLAFGELYIALQQGLMDAQENPLDTIVNNNMGEVQKYIIMTNHVPFVATFIMNKAFYESMPEEYQELVTAILDEIAADNLKNYESINQNALDKLINDNGCEVIELSSDVLEQMRTLAEPIWQGIQDEIGTELSDALNNTLKTIQ